MVMRASFSNYTQCMYKECKPRAGTKMVVKMCNMIMHAILKLSFHPHTLHVTSMNGTSL